MKTSTIIIGVLLFAFATVLIYIWGTYRQINQTKDLMNLLFSKGEAKVRKYMKKNESITRKQVEEMVVGLRAQLPFTSQKAVVTDSKDFAEKLLGYMQKTGQLRREGSKYFRT